MSGGDEGNEGICQILPLPMFAQLTRLDLTPRVHDNFMELLTLEPGSPRRGILPALKWINLFKCTPSPGKLKAMIRSRVSGTPGCLQVVIVCLFRRELDEEEEVDVTMYQEDLHLVEPSIPRLQITWGPSI